MIDYDGFKKYLQKTGLKSYSNYISLLKSLIKILNKIDEFSTFNEIDKLKIFINKSKDFKYEFDKYHNKNDDTFQDSISVVKKYLLFSNIHDNNKKDTFVKKYPLNQILYGPPGTGKTYNTINRALEIIDGVVPQDRENARERFNELREEGQIEFVTFHQSYGYEEFVEGIKADLESDEIRYILENGIFKRLVERTTLLKRTHDIKNIDFSEYLTINQKFQTTRGVEFKIISLNEKIKIENSQNKEYSLSRKSILEYLEKQDFDNTRGHYSYQPIIAKEIFNKLDNTKLEDNTNKNYILIIDEINRGNISKIFGELITLIEPSKRIGAGEALKLTLPNSKDSFGVPSNLYIIGTMNTADRSIAQIDTALRRRFEFVEMMPDHSLLKDIMVVHNDKTIEIQKVLEAINERIEYIYDREHTIGHNYFMPLIKEPTKEKLDEIFKVNILPLLAEYFYGDWEDIRFVLNNDFVEEKKISSYIKNSSRQLNKVYEINEIFKPSEYLKIYATDNN